MELQFSSNNRRRVVDVSQPENNLARPRNWRQLKNYFKENVIPQWEAKKNESLDVLDELTEEGSVTNVKDIDDISEYPPYNYYAKSKFEYDTLVSNLKNNNLSSKDFDLMNEYFRPTDENNIQGEWELYDEPDFWNN